MSAPEDSRVTAEILRAATDDPGGFDAVCRERGYLHRHDGAAVTARQVGKPEPVERQTIARQARPLVRAIKATLGEEFWRGRSPDIEVIKTDREGIIVVRSEDLIFFFEPTTRELTAGRTGPDGQAEFGGIASDGTIRWGWAVVNRMSLN